MSSINNGHRPRVPGAIDPNDNSNLSKIAKRQGIFQGPAGDDKTEGSGEGKGKAQGGKTAPKGPQTKVGAGAAAGGAAGGAAGQAAAAGGAAGASATGIDDTLESGTSGAAGAAAANAAGLPQTSVPQDSILPTTPTQNLATSNAQDIKAVGDLATSPSRLNDTVNLARGRLAQDMNDPTTSQATLQKDITALSSALDQAGITEPPVAAIINTMVDPYGTKDAPSAALQAAAQAQGIDLSADNADPAAAKDALQKALAQNPPLDAAVDMATSNLMRVNALSGTDPAAALKDVAANTAEGSSGLAALYAAAAKAGVDLTGKDDDSTASAKNKAAQGKLDKAEKKARADEAAAGSNAAQISGSGGGQGRSTGGGGSADIVNNNDASYASIPKTGAGSSAGGWDTSGNEAIAPNPDNPVNFEKDYGIKGGFTSESLDDLLARVPSLTQQYPNIKEILTNAANSVSPAIPPQLLLSTLGVETSYATNPNNAQDGPFQFISSTFDVYGKGDRTNMQDAANACANYYKTLLQENGGDLFAAMRDYNGDVTKGASNSYQKDQQSIFNGNMG